MQSSHPQRRRPLLVTGHLVAGFVAAGVGVVSAWPAGAQTSSDTAARASVGPANGALVIAGGALQGTEITGRFVELAGGPRAPIVVIPTALGADRYPQSLGKQIFADTNASNVTVIHTADRAEADSDAFVAPIRAARGVWFSGGRQWRLVDAYHDTQVVEALWELLERGGVIGGSSAGATIQGAYLARGDSQTNTIIMGDHEEGFAFLRGTAIDQHLIKRNRHFDMIEIIEAHPELLGLGIDEDTAIVVEGDRFEVIGSGYVGIYDHQRMIDGESGGRFYFMAPGDRFDLVNRQAYRPSRTYQPLDRVLERSWTEAAPTHDP